MELELDFERGDKATVHSVNADGKITIKVRRVMAVNTRTTPVTYMVQGDPGQPWLKAEAGITKDGKPQLLHVA